MLPGRQRTSYKETMNLFGHSLPGVSLLQGCSEEREGRYVEVGSSFETVKGHLEVAP